MNHDHPTALDLLSEDPVEVQAIIDSVPVPDSLEILGDDPIHFGTHLSRLGTHTPDFGTTVMGAGRFGTRKPRLGTHAPNFGINVVGQVVETYDDGDAYAQLNADAAGPSFGTGTPDGTDPEFGVDDEVDLGVIRVGAEDEDEDGADAPISHDLDMLLDDDNDYGDDEPGDTDIYGDQSSEDVGNELLALALTAHDSGIESDYAVGNIVDADIVGENFNAQAAPEFRDSVSQRVAKNIPILLPHPKPTELRDWDISFGPASAPAGETLTLFTTPQALFRGEKVLATDSVGGIGTRIMSVTVGQRVQRPSGTHHRHGGGALTSFFSQTALGNGNLWDTCQSGMTIYVVVSFVQACTFDMSVLGKCVL